MMASCSLLAKCQKLTDPGGEPSHTSCRRAPQIHGILHDWSAGGGLACRLLPSPSHHVRLRLRRPAIARHRRAFRASCRPGRAAPAAAPLPLPQVLLCDLDGTLIDTMPTLADIAAEVMEAVYGTPGILARELYLATCGLPFASQLEEIYPGDPRNAGASDMFESRKPARCNKIQMPAETRRALDDLRAAGVRIVVSSNNGVENVDTFARGAPASGST